MALLVTSLLIGTVASAQKASLEGNRVRQDAPAASPAQLKEMQREDIEGVLGEQAQQSSVQRLRSLGAERCVGGLAGPFPCKHVDLLGFVSLAEMSALSANDIWGWSDPRTGKEYALIGLNNGTGFVDITRPKRPEYLGKLPTQTEESIWASPHDSG